ncbi:MAG TPA: DUF1810 domain-containing protein, partial [Burkholderiaceae bacterium]|nr:DUF1810 domain-containing protein [Burkholderiaceae bacterium]
PHNLGRFLSAQADSYGTVISELCQGRKRSHWMWYIFPQYVGLGLSPASQCYAIKSMSEVGAYLSHPVLGPRLIECFEAVMRIERRSAREIFGAPDDLKLKSSATLFARASAPDSVFQRVLDKYFDGERDGHTLRLIASS